MARRGAVHSIGIICWQTFGGGAERATLLWARFARDVLRLRVVWLFTSEADAVAAQREPGIVFAQLPRTVAKRAEALRQKLYEHDIDTVLFVDHSVALTFVDILVAKECGCRTIVAEHNAFFYPLDNCDSILYRLRENFYPCVDVVTALSPANVAWWRATGLKNVVYMPNFLTFEPDGSGADRRPPQTDVPEFLFMGRICDRKGLHYVLDAFDAYLKGDVGRKRGGHLTVCGRFDSETPEYEVAIRAQLARLDLGDKVTLTGEIQDVKPYICRSRVLLMASRIEGAPMVLMECKSHGVPAIVFELPFVDACSESDGVLNVPYADTGRMASFMSELVQDDERWMRLSRGAYASLSRYSSDRISERWRAVFAALETGGDAFDPQCELPSSDEMLQITMRACSGFTRALADYQSKLIGIEYTPAWRTGRVVEGACLEGSVSYRLGHLMTAPVRLLKRVLCYNKNDDQ